MEPWSALRDSVCDAEFLPSLKEHGIDAFSWDEVRPDVDEVLCGASEDSLNLIYPPNSEGLRLLLTEPHRGTPSLRVAFRLEASGPNGKIVYFRGASR